MNIQPRPRHDVRVSCREAVKTTNIGAEGPSIGSFRGRSCESFGYVVGWCAENQAKRKQGRERWRTDRSPIGPLDFSPLSEILPGQLLVQGVLTEAGPLLQMLG